MHTKLRRGRHAPSFFPTMKKFAFFPVILLMVFATSSLFAGNTGKIAGRVIDAETREPLPGANVVVKGTRLGASTDLDGYYFILNVPPGTYEVEASMLSYQTVVKKDVVVRADYTTYVDFELRPSALKMKELVVTAKKPPVQIDIVSTSQSIESGLIKKLPSITVKDILTTKAGIIPDLTFKGLTENQSQEQFQGNPNDGLHFRGGRENETAYFLEGISLNDPIFGGFLMENLPSGALAEMTAYTGTFSAEYGGALSAVVNMVLPEASTRNISVNTMTDWITPDSNRQNMVSSEFSLKQPFLGRKLSVFLAGKFYTTDGRFYGYIYPNWRDSEGRDKSGVPVKVPMSYRDINSLVGRVSYHPTPKLRLDFIGLYDTVQTMEYLHFFKYAPYDAPRFWMGDRLGGLRVNFVPSTSTFISFEASIYDKTYKGGVYDSLDLNLVEKHLISPEGFAVSGVAYLWKFAHSTTKEARLDLTTQRGMHQLQLGVDYRSYMVHFERRNPTAPDPMDTVPPYDMAPWELYTRYPVHYSGYFQDKIEFRDIGMVLNFGARFDVVDPKTYWLEDYKKLGALTAQAVDSLMGIGEIYQVKPKGYFSPRIGVSYPVSDVAAFRFSYGVFHQFPAFFLLYQGLNEHSDVYPIPNTRDNQTAVGNGEMKPERVTSYEVGVQYAVRPDITLNMAAFYRDLADLIGRTLVSGPDVPVQYYMFDNKAYGVIKGIEIILNKRLTNRVSGYVDYTFTHVRISQPDVLYFPQVQFHRPVVADWEIPHKLSFAVSYAVSEGFTVSVSGFYSSGLPYSLGIEPNTERGPSLKQIDLKLNKEIRLPKKDIVINTYLQIFNLFNFKNIYWVYPATGRPGDDGNPATSPDWDRNPTQYGPGRRLIFGLNVNL